MREQGMTAEAANRGGSLDLILLSTFRFVGAALDASVGQAWGTVFRRQGYR